MKKSAEAVGLKLLNYTWATILEVMRVSSSVPFSMPHSTIMHTEINGYRIGKNTFIMVNLHSIHMNEDPEAFRPARLLDKDNRISKDVANRIVPLVEESVLASTCQNRNFPSLYIINAEM